MDDVNQVLIDRLVRKGAEASLVESLLKALSKILAEDPNIDPVAANQRLHYLGWPEVQVDYHTLQLALACFESRSWDRPGAFAEDDARRRALRLREVEVTPIALNDL
jgi:hypothetical protein